MAQLINEAEIQQTWAPLIESTTGITDTNKVKWMSKVAHFQNLNESVYNTAHLNPDMNINGMGPVTLPGNPTSIDGFAGQAKGSGDTPYSLLPLAMQVAAQTIGLDLVPVVPMNGPLGMLSYIDFVYAGGKIDSKEAPLIVKINQGPDAGSYTAGTAYFVKSAAAADASSYKLTYISDSRIDGYPIFKVEATANDGTGLGQGAAGSVTLAAAIAGGDLYDAAALGGAVVATHTGATKAELVKALEDHVTGFSGAEFGTNDPYSRDAGESTPDNLMGLTTYNKSVEAKTFQVAASVTREQIQDLKTYGIDAVAQVEAVLTAELTQGINKLILDRLFALGASNHVKAGVDMNINFAGAATLSLGKDMEGNVATMAAATPQEATFGGETKGDIQRRILSKVLGAASIIAIRGRRGAANFAVVNGQVATALQNIAGFVAYPMANTINQSSGSLFPVGSIAGINVYTDPNMAWNDTRVLVGRKGDGNSPGLVFMPYLMAEAVETIAEGTMSPKIALKSRFGLVDAGQHPETMYMTFKINLGGDVPNLI